MADMIPARNAEELRPGPGTVGSRGSPRSAISPTPAASPIPRATASIDEQFAAIYDRWFHEVTRWARGFGVADAELEDVAQEVFLVVRRKLGGFDGKNLGGWLYRITARTASDLRRRAWFRHLVGRRRASVEEIPHRAVSPEDLYASAESRRRLDRLLDRMSAKRREAFWLFEVEGYSGVEIAGLLDIPEATVWTRLHLARKQFLTLVAEDEMEEPRSQR